MSSKFLRIFISCHPWIDLLIWSLQKNTQIGNFGCKAAKPEQVMYIPQVDLARIIDFKASDLNMLGIQMGR